MIFIDLNFIHNYNAVKYKFKYKYKFNAVKYNM